MAHIASEVVGSAWRTSIRHFRLVYSAKIETPRMSRSAARTTVTTGCGRTRSAHNRCLESLMPGTRLRDALGAPRRTRSQVGHGVRDFAWMHLNCRLAF